MLSSIEVNTIEDDDLLPNWDDDVPATDPLPKKDFRCGMLRRKVDLHTGMSIWYHDYCKHPRECPICRARKEDEMRQRLLPLLKQDNIRVFTHQQPIADVTRQYGSKKIINLPSLTENWAVVETDDPTIGEPLTLELIEKIVPFAVAPEGRRISGKLGKITCSAPVDNEERLPVTQRVCLFLDAQTGMPTEREIVEKIEQVVIEETIDLDPKTADEVQYAVYQVEEKTVEIAARYGVKILFLYTETNMLYLGRLDWSKRRQWRKNAQIRPPLSARNG